MKLALVTTLLLRGSPIHSHPTTKATDENLKCKAVRYVIIDDNHTEPYDQAHHRTDVALRLLDKPVQPTCLTWRQFAWPVEPLPNTQELSVFEERDLMSVIRSALKWSPVGIAIGSAATLAGCTYKYFKNSKEDEDDGFMACIVGAGMALLGSAYPAYKTVGDYRSAQAAELVKSQVPPWETQPEVQTGSEIQHLSNPHIDSGPAISAAGNGDASIPLIAINDEIAELPGDNEFKPFIAANQPWIAEFPADNEIKPTIPPPSVDVGTSEPLIDNSIQTLPPVNADLELKDIPVNNDIEHPLNLDVDTETAKSSPEDVFYTPLTHFSPEQAGVESNQDVEPLSLDHVDPMPIPENAVDGVKAGSNSGKESSILADVNTGKTEVESEVGVESGAAAKSNAIIGAKVEVESDRDKEPLSLTDVDPMPIPEIEVDKPMARPESNVEPATESEPGAEVESEKQEEPLPLADIDPSPILEVDAEKTDVKSGGDEELPPSTNADPLLLTDVNTGKADIEPVAADEPAAKVESAEVEPANIEPASEIVSPAKAEPEANSESETDSESMISMESNKDEEILPPANEELLPISEAANGKVADVDSKSDESHLPSSHVEPVPLHGFAMPGGFPQDDHTHKVPWEAPVTQDARPLTKGNGRGKTKDMISFWESKPKNPVFPSSHDVHVKGGHVKNPKGHRQREIRGGYFKGSTNHHHGHLHHSRRGKDLARSRNKRSEIDSSVPKPARLASDMLLHHVGTDEPVSGDDITRSNKTHPLYVYHNGRYAQMTRGQELRMWSEFKVDVGRFRVHTLIDFPREHGTPDHNDRNSPASMPSGMYYGYDLYEPSEPSDGFGNDESNDFFRAGLVMMKEYQNNDWRQMCVCQQRRGSRRTTGVMQYIWEDVPFDSDDACWATTCH